MATTKVFIIVLVLYNTFFWALSENCHHRLHYLANQQQLYLFCSTVNAVPVKLCTACEPKFTDMVIAYTDVRDNCSDIYFNHDRINVVETTQKMLLGLWQKAFCDDCFNSNNTQVFTEKNDTLTTCLNTNKGSECASCISEYEDLNSFYTKLDEHNNGKICYDLQDAMNITRVLWSKTLNCCHRQFRMTAFLVVTALVGILPFLFYIAAYVLTKRRENNPQVLNINDNIPNGHHQVHPSSSEPVVMHTEQPKLSKLHQLDSDSDDDDIIPRMKNIL